MNLDRLKQDLLRDEGLRLVSYKDTLGFWTIGVGHLLGTGKEFEGLVWTKDQALRQLDADVLKCEEWVTKLPSYSACNTDARQRALLNMGFQLGSKLLTFNTFLMLVQQQRWVQAGDDLKTTLWAKETPVRAGRVIQAITNGI